MRKRKAMSNYFFDNERPIYVQLVEMIRIDIVSGRYKQGEKIPSVRELALKMKVNPNTMQKALSELESEGLIYTERTNGKFVTEDSAQIERIKEKLASDKVASYLDSMQSIGLSYEDALEYLKKAEKK